MQTCVSNPANGPSQSEIMKLLCGGNNVALYGSCLASDAKSLQAERVGAVYSGLPYNFVVIKKDAYNNTIVSDSTTLLEAIPVLQNELRDSSTSILGSAISRMISGVATFSFALKATFTDINFVSKSASVYPPILLRIEGTDAESTKPIKSNQLSLDMKQGVAACPPGYVLTLDTDGASKSQAVCTLCKVGTYSLNPLANTPNALTRSPTCINCPAGLTCNGGADVKPKQQENTWLAVEGVYYLISCPAGSQLVNSTSGTSRGTFSSDLQQCRACAPGQYIVDPNTDECQQCPPGNIHFQT